MLSRMNLRNKILIPIGLVVLIVSFVSISMVVVLVDNIFRKNALTLSRESANRLGAEARGELEKTAATVRTLSSALEDWTEAPPAEGRVASLLRKALARSPGVSAFWLYTLPDDTPEPHASTPTMTGWFRFSGEVRSRSLADYPDQIRLAENAISHSGDRLVLAGPTPFPPAATDEAFFQVIATIKRRGRVAAAVGAVVSTNALMPLFSTVTPAGSGFGFLVSNDGVIAGHPRKSLVGQPLDALVRPERTRSLKAAIRNGQPHVIFNNELVVDSTIAYVVFIPFSIEGDDAFWIAAVAVPEASVMADTRAIGYRAAGIGSVSILILILVIFSLSRRIVKPLYTLVDVSKSLAGGDFGRRAHLTSDDEFGMAGRYIDKAFDIVIDKMFWYEGMMDAIPFPISVTDLDLQWTFINRAAEKALKADRHQVAGRSCREWRHQFCAPGHCGVDLLKKGKPASVFSDSEKDLHYQIDAAWLHNAKGDRIGHIEIIQDISEATRLKRKADERNWLRTGEVGLNDLMRGEVGMAQLGSDVISFICRYLEASVGVFYVMDPAETRLTLRASYGYRRRKRLSQDFEPGEGVVGQAALEKSTILLTRVPPDHLSIDSGIGVSDPVSVVAVPCVFEERVKAVLELGAFHVFTDLQLAFLENVAVQIGVVVNTAESRQELRRLLEQTQQQAETLRRQQETLKRTNEELENQTRALRASEADLQSQQEELRVTNEELEERTRALEIQRDEIRKKNLELEQARQEIEQKARDLELASRYKSQFLANMSHELRTPLNSILILSQLLAQNSGGGLTEKQVEFARTIHSSGSDLLSLINEILDLSKVEAGKLDIVTEEVNLNELLGNVRRTFEPLIREKGLYLELETEDGVPEYMNTDAKRIWQILKNLMSNAVKFTETGGVTLTVRRPGPAERFSASGLSTDTAVGFTVKDTGIGIPKEKQEAVFSVFEQADGTTSRKYGGTGLGLSISREFARYMGGEIQLESEPGRGSAFTLFLPEMPDPAAFDTAAGVRADAVRSKADPPAQVKKPPIPDPAATIKDDRRNVKAGDRTLLIIEDDPNFSKVLLELARSRGFKGLIAEDGENGLHFADFYQPTAIILDVGLPGMDGWEVMRRLKSNADTRHIPVHFISAMDRPMQAMKMGAVGFIVKPASMETLENAFRQIEEKALKPVKKLLVIEDDALQIRSIRELLGNGDLEILAAETARDALAKMAEDDFDCVILDLGLADASGVDLLTEIKRHSQWSSVPIIVYTGKSLTAEEEDRLNRYADSIIIKGVRSMERLLDETTLFLHRLESDLPDASRTILSMFHDKDAVLRDKKIMVVDDDMRNVFALASVLEQKGAVLVEARNGIECLEKLNAHPDTDLVVMDIMMPEMDGYEAMRKIRSDRRYRDLKIIALTAKAMKGDKQKCIDAGANDYIAKPVDTDKLMSLLRVWLY